MAMAATEASALHTPVMLAECLDLLAPALSAQNDAVFIDCTLGMGGHTQAVLERFEHVRVIGIDRDPQAIEIARRRLVAYGSRFIPMHTTYDKVQQVANEYGREGKVDGVLMDLGVSSFQLDTPSRGFSYARSAVLDMRMNPNASVTAADIVNESPEAELIRILRIYGEEKFAHRIARAIVTRRSQAPIERTEQLVAIVREAIPAPARRTGGNPAKRTFQALRIAVNNELEILERALPAAISALSIGGRLVVEAYQSLEDRLVKECFRAASQSSTPSGVPMELPGHEPYVHLLTTGAQKASSPETTANPRAASVRLRAIEIVREGYHHSPATQRRYQEGEIR